MKKTTYIFIALGALILIGGVVYWFAFMNKTPVTETETEPTPGNVFNPLNRNNTTPSPASNTPSTQGTSTETITETTPAKIPALRQISTSPISGAAASTTASTTLVRFIDRGTGHVYEARDTDMSIDKVSNTTLPKVYETYWNKNLTAFILRYLKEDSDTIVNFYAQLKSTGTTTGDTVTPYEIKGAYLSPDIREVAVSPTKDKIFTWNIEGGKGVGYISGFDEKNKVKLIEMPITDVVVEWPEISKAYITTRASAYATGYVYSVDTKTGSLKKVFGGLHGLSSKMSTDGQRLLYSTGAEENIQLRVLNIKDQKSQSMPVRTLAEKCVWSTLQKTDIYCAVPTEISRGVYPDDWYKGSVEFVDQIWHINSATGEVHLLAKLLSISNTLIDATNLTLDPKENFLYFTNKKDLTLWSLDLNN